MTDIKRILTSESTEQRFNVKKKMQAASALLKEDNDCEDELLEYYFSEGNILIEDSASGTSSSTSWNNWQGISYQVYIDAPHYFIGDVWVQQRNSEFLFLRMTWCYLIYSRIYQEILQMKH